MKRKGANYEIVLGDSLAHLRDMPSGSIDAVIADPPYSSGGFTRSDRNADPSTKYVTTGTEIVRASFSGDNRDGRSWCYWMALWMSEAQRVTKEAGYCLIFSDWRQLPLATDALQAAGFVWRGIVAWNKGRGSRAPHTGYYRHQCEYIVWGTNGISVPASHGGPWDGCVTFPVVQADKYHMTGKPTALMKYLVQCVPVGATVLDPCMGSGTTGVACVSTGRRFVGVEKEPSYFEISSQRIEQAAAQPMLFGDDTFGVNA